MPDEISPGKCVSLRSNKSVFIDDFNENIYEVVVMTMKLYLAWDWMEGEEVEGASEPSSRRLATKDVDLSWVARQ